MLHKSFKSAKCKTALNLAKARVKIMKNKKDIQMKQLRREIAQLLQNNQDQTARIRVEHVVREEKMLAAYEMIEIYCELVVARLPVIESQKVCPLDLKEAITSLIFAAPRCGDIPELQDVRKHFAAKYGKEFIAAAVELRPACGVSRTMVEKLSVQAPDGPTKVKILKGIAEEHNIQWEPNWFKDEEPVSSGEILKKPYTDNNNTIQMEPLNVQLADDFEEQHAHSMKNSEISSERHIPAKSKEILPSSTSRPDFRPAGNVSVEALSSQNSGTTENVFPTDKQHMNLRFKDATEAAQAAAESAELASMAARAAAQFSMRESSHEPARSSEHANVHRHKHEQGNPVNSSSNLRNPRLQGHQGYTDMQSDMTESELRDDRSANKEFSQTGVQYDARQHEFRESKSPYRVNSDSLSQSTDHVSVPSTSKDDSNWSSSPNVQDYEPKLAQNPFHEDTEAPQNQPNKVYSQSSSFGDEYGVFSNSHYQSDEIDPYGSFSVFGQGTSEQESWHAKTTYIPNSSSHKDETINKDYGERNVFQESDEKKYRYESGTGGTVTDQGFSGLGVDETAGHNVATAVFDESGSDDDDEYVLVDAEEKHESPSSKLSSRDSFFQQDNLHFEPDFSESFRKSPIYAKLLEPVPAFDDYDEPSPRSVKGLQTESSISDSRGSTEFIRPSSVEKGTAFSEENPMTYAGTVNEGEGTKSPRSFRLPSESKDHAPVFDDPSSESGIELNLGPVPSGRRNRPSWQPPYTLGGLSGVSSPSRFSEAANEDFGTYEDKERSYSGKIHENMRGTRAKEPAVYIESDESASEEDVPKPVITKILPGAGISRRTKGSTKLVSSRLSSNPDDTTKMGRFSSNSSYATDDSPKRQTKTTGSSSRSAAEPDLNDHATFERRSEKKVSRNNESFSPPSVEKPSTPTTVEITRAPVSSEKAPSRENSGKNLSHVHPKLPDFETFTAHLQSLRTKRQ